MPAFRAFRIHQSEEKIQGRLETLHIDDLPQGEVLIEAAYSGVNYKDALAATGSAPILRRFPLTGGIDVAGRVADSTDPRFTPGEEVLVTGCGLGESHDGGYAGYVRVPAGWVIPVPEGLSLREAMALGTAGFTAALAVERLEANGQRPELGPLAVTGATGGVGSLALDILAGRGYQVAAITGKPAKAGYLRGLGAAEVLSREELELGRRPLEKARWGGAVDSVGGKILAWLTRTVKPWGSIAVVGLAGGSELHTTVMPFILRGVSLLGIHSVEVPDELRRRIWRRLGGDLRARRLEAIAAREVSLEELPGIFGEFLAGAVAGRTVVRLEGSRD